MKIAFDVQGTLVGGRQSELALKLFKVAQDLGHEMFVWSNGGFAMAYEACNELGLKAMPMNKVYRYEMAGGGNVVDLCVDDDMHLARLLASEDRLSVFSIPEDPDEFETFCKELGL